MPYRIYDYEHVEAQPLTTAAVVAAKIEAQEWLCASADAAVETVAADYNLDRFIDCTSVADSSVHAIAGWSPDCTQAEGRQGRCH